MEAAGETRVCAAVPTDDGETVKLGHFGDARLYHFYQWTGNGWKPIRKVENPYAGEHHHDDEHGHHENHHGHSGKRRRILELIRDCNVVISVAFGPGGKQAMEKAGKKVVTVHPRTTITEALNKAAQTLGLKPTDNP